MYIIIYISLNYKCSWYFHGCNRSMDTYSEQYIQKIKLADLKSIY